MVLQQPLFLYSTGIIQLSKDKFSLEPYFLHYNYDQKKQPTEDC